MSSTLMQPDVTETAHAYRVAVGIGSDRAHDRARLPAESKRPGSGLKVKVSWLTGPVDEKFELAHELGAGSTGHARQNGSGRLHPVWLRGAAQAMALNGRMRAFDNTCVSVGRHATPAFVSLPTADEAI